MAAASVLAWLQDAYVYNPDFLFRPGAAWGDLHASNFSGANYTGEGGADSAASNVSGPLVLGSARTLTSAANVGLATGVLLAVLLNSHYDAIKREWRSEYQLWTEALIIRVAFSIVCLLLALFVTPVALAVFVCFACYRNTVHILLKVVHGGRFVGLMDGVDTVWALEEDTSKSVVNVLGMLEVDDAPDDDVLLMTLRQAIVSRFFTSSNQCQKLLHLRRRSVLGYFYWERQRGLQINSHVRWMPDGLRLEDDGGITEETLGLVVSKLANTRLPADHASSWEILVSRRPMTKLCGDPFQSMEEGFPVRHGRYRKYPVVFRVHHAVGDGVALLRLMTGALVKDTSMNTKPAAIQRDGNLPDICITSGESSFTKEISSGILQNENSCPDKGEGGHLTVQRNNSYETSPPKLQIIATDVRTDQNWKNKYKSLSRSEESSSEKTNHKGKLSQSEPLEFQSDKIYGNSNMKIPCYATDKISSSKNTGTKCVSIRKANANMVVYFQKSLPESDNDFNDVENKGNLLFNSRETINNTDNVTKDMSGTSESDCNEIGIDMSQLEDDIFSKKELEFSLTMEHKPNFNSHLPEVRVTKKYSDQLPSCFYSSPHSHISSANKNDKMPGPPRCKSPILSGDIYSQNKIIRQHTPDCLVTKEHINDGAVYLSEDFRPHVSDTESRPCSPVSRPVSPTPYSLNQQTSIVLPLSPTSNSSRPVSRNSLHSSSDNRTFSPTNMYLNSETRPATPCSPIPNYKERPVSPSCLLSILETHISPNNISFSSEEKHLQTSSGISASPMSKQLSPLKRSLSPNKLKGISISKSTKSNSKNKPPENSRCHTPLPKTHSSGIEITNCDVNYKSQFTVVPLDSSQKRGCNNKKDYFKTNGKNKIIDFLKNLFYIPKREKMFVKSNDSTKFNNYVKLLSTINGGNAKEFQTLSRIWHVISALIYAPASLIHQVLMKASDKNSLHGPTLSGEKVITWYSDNSTPSICKEYRLLNTIKRIKSRVTCEARFTDIFLTAVSSSLEMYFQYKETGVPSSVNVVVPLRMEPMPEEMKRKIGESRTAKDSHPPFMPTIPEDNPQKKSKNLEKHSGDIQDSELTFINLPLDTEKPQPSNQFSVALMTLPIAPQTGDEPLKPYNFVERIQEVWMQSELLRNSLDYQVNYWLMRVVATLLPAPLLWPVLNSTQSTLVVSNVKGPSEDIYLGGYKLGDLVFWVPNRGTTGVGISLLGYADRLQVGLIADMAVVPTRQDANAILHNILSELRQMDASLST